MGSKVHKVRYYNPKPKSINCLSYNKLNKCVAVAREDATLEIWDLTHTPYILKSIPGVENGSIEAVAWVKERLFSTGLGGALVEWDLEKLCVKSTVLLTGYAAWCLDVNNLNTLAAVGTEQGYVNLYSVEENEIVYKRLFDKQEGRIMCCKFDNTGSILVTGSIDTIRVWNVETGQAMSRMSARRRGKETIVWCLSVLSDNTVVSGESRGRLSFWDINTGDQIESFTTHKSDILSLVVSEDEKSFYCSGLDPVIVNFIKVDTNKKTGSNSQWVRNVQRNIHEHDVRGLALQGATLISVGVDGYMTFSSFPPKWVMRIPPMLPPLRSAISAEKRLLLLKYTNHIEVWKLGSYAMNESGNIMKSVINMNNSISQKKQSNLESDSAVACVNKANIDKGISESLILTEKSTKLVSVQTKGQRQVKCSTMSPNGTLIVYATETDIRMLKLETEEEIEETSLSKVLISGLVITTCDRMSFTEDSKFLLLHYTGTLYVLHVDAEAGATLVQTIDASKYLKSPTLLHLYISKKTLSGNMYVVAADTTGSIAVWTQTKKNKFEHYATLPKYQCVPSAITVNHKQETLLAVYVDQKIIEYELETKKFRDWPMKQLPPAWFSRKSAVQSIHVHPERDMAIILQDETSLWILERNETENEEPIKKKKSNESLASKNNASLRIIPIKYVSDFHWLDDEEAVIVESLPENIVSLLPPVVQRKRPPYLTS